jgi:hypothetical protein
LSAHRLGTARAIGSIAPRLIHAKVDRRRLRPSGVTDFYAANVTTAGGFLVTATGFADFERAAISKIGREVSNVPEPGTLALAGLAIAGLGFGTRRRG